MNKRQTLILLLLMAGLLAACSAPAPATVDEAPADTGADVEDAPVEAETEPEPETQTEAAPAEEAIFMPEYPEFEGHPLPADRGEYMTGSGVCITCHANLVDEAGNNVSNGDFWKGSMMANAALDPYWLATVEHEVHEFPELETAIEDICSNCHMPLAHFEPIPEGREAGILNDGWTDPTHPQHTLAMDGVSCTLCHQVEPDNFGEDESFTGGYLLNPDLPLGERFNYGPFPVEEGLDVVMSAGSGYIPVQGEHMQESEHCATCHTLYTSYIDGEGNIAGTFPEQTPYLEWLASSFADSMSCQDCHMPEAEGGVQLSITGGPLREPFRIHSFAGGNNTMLRIMRMFGEELGTAASSADFDGAIARMEDQLQNDTAVVAIQNTALSGSEISFDVLVANVTGHKLPTAYPSRRVWLHVAVMDSRNAIVWESGLVNPDGSINGNDNDADALAYEPHYDLITLADEVQIYEAILANTEDEVTTTLLRAASLPKDNRLLPPGFDFEIASEDVLVHGAAERDDDFGAGSDVVSYAIDLADFEGPFQVFVELNYQAIGYRWADNFHMAEGERAEAFLGYYDAVPNLPVTLVRVQTTIE